MEFVATVRLSNRLGLCLTKRGENVVGSPCTKANASLQYLDVWQYPYLYEGDTIGYHLCLHNSYQPKGNGYDADCIDTPLNDVKTKLEFSRTLPKLAEPFTWQEPGHVVTPHRKTALQAPTSGQAASLAPLVGSSAQTWSALATSAPPLVINEPPIEKTPAEQPPRQPPPEVGVFTLQNQGLCMTVIGGFLITDDNRPANVVTRTCDGRRGQRFWVYKDFAGFYQICQERPSDGIAECLGRPHPGRAPGQVSSFDIDFYNLNRYSAGFTWNPEKGHIGFNGSNGHLRRGNGDKVVLSESGSDEAFRWIATPVQ